MQSARWVDGLRNAELFDRRRNRGADKFKFVSVRWIDQALKRSQAACLPPQPECFASRRTEPMVVHPCVAIDARQHPLCLWRKPPVIVFPETASVAHDVHVAAAFTYFLKRMQLPVEGIAALGGNPAKLCGERTHSIGARRSLPVRALTRE